MGKPKGKRTLGRLGIDARLISKLILKKQVCTVKTELIWLWTGTSGMVLYTRIVRSLRVLKTLGIL